MKNALRMIRSLLVPALLAFHVTCMAGEPFDAAVARAQTDSAEPANAVWASAMSEAVGNSIRTAFEVCLKGGQPQAAVDLSLVFDVMPDGRVAKVWAASDSVFTTCLAREVTASTYPRPATEAYFSLIQNHPLATSGT